MKAAVLLCFSAVLVILSGFGSLALGLSLPIASICVFMLILGAAILLLHSNLGSRIQLSYFALLLAATGAVCLGVSRHASAMDAIAASAAVLIVPTCLLLAAESVPSGRTLALWFVRVLGVSQIPLWLLNQFGIWTSTSFQDKFEGLFVTRGAYLSLFVFALWLAVEAIIRRNAWFSAACALSVGFIGYWTENRSSFALIGITVCVALTASALSKALNTQRITRALLVTAAIAALVFGVVLSAALPAKDWGTWRTPGVVTSEFLPTSESTYSQNTLSATVRSKPDPGSNCAPITSLPMAYTCLIDFKGRIWNGNSHLVIFGLGSSLGLSHVSQQVQSEDGAADEMRIPMQNPTGSIFWSAETSLGALISEWGLLGLLLWVTATSLIVQRLWSIGNRPGILIILAPMGALWLVTSTLESPILPIAFALALSALPRMRDGVKTQS